MWKIDVHAGSYFPELSRQFGGNDFNLISQDYPETGPSFQASSPHANNICDLTEVRRRIYSLQVILNGALRASKGEIPKKPIEFTRFWDIKSGQKHKIDADRLHEFPFSDSVTLEEDSLGPEVNNVSHLIHLSKESDSIRITLLLLGLISRRKTIEKIHSWNILYRIYETVKHYCSKYNWELDCFADKDKLDEFTGACNNMSAIGFYARHGFTDRPAPKKYLSSLDKATGLIVEMANRFVVKEVKENHT